MSRASKTFIALAACLSLASVGCKEKQETVKEPEGYRIVGFDAKSMHWAIIRTGTFDGKYLKKRLLVTCALYKAAGHVALTGPDACSLRVGKLIVPNPLPAAGQENKFVDVWEAGSERLFITEGDGSGKVEQQFTIEKYEVLPDDQ